MSKYQELTIIEKIELVGKLVHAIQSCDTSFEFAQQLLKEAENRNLFLNVKILPDDFKENS